MESVFYFLGDCIYDLFNTIGEFEFMGFTTWEFALWAFVIHSFARFVLVPSLGGRISNPFSQGKSDSVKVPKQNEIGFVLHDPFDKRLR